MRVALAMLTLVPGEMGGSERYARELARALPAAGVDVTAVLPPGVATPFEGLPAEVLPYRATASRPGRLAAMTHGAVALRGRLAPYDVVHFPFTIPVPAASSPWITTMHDLQHRDLPGLFSRAERAFRAVAYDRAARKADRVVVISEFVRDRAVALLRIPADLIRVIPLAVDHERFHPDDGRREDFLLYPARPWSHKNHARLLEALALLRRSRPGLRLVLTGGGHGRTLAPEGVEVRGPVTDDELAALYRRAACLVFPSLYEGFGLPPLEAMASGCPVAASSAAAIPEVCGDAAALFDPHDPAAIARGVLEALERADELTARGLARAAEYTWARTAAAHAEVYAELS